MEDTVESSVTAGQTTSRGLICILFHAPHEYGPLVPAVKEAMRATLGIWDIVVVECIQSSCP